MVTPEPDTRARYLRDGYAHLGRLPDRRLVDDLATEAERLYEQPPTRRELLTHPGETALNLRRLLAVEQRSRVVARALTDPSLGDIAAELLGVDMARPVGATLLCAPPRSPSPRPARLPHPGNRHGTDEDLVHLWLPVPATQSLRVVFRSHTARPPLLSWARLRSRRRRSMGCGLCAGDGFAVHPGLMVAMSENQGTELHFATVLTYRRHPEATRITTAEEHR
ncbi:hypothetical protein [Embleya sp. NPDC020630]|uniref:hypothetical protein n=1 Tax=Embleya sp. NPDC020630 TaxID=3363979 RepID=UPI003792D524